MKNKLSKQTLIDIFDYIVLNKVWRIIMYYEKKLMKKKDMNWDAKETVDFILNDHYGDFTVYNDKSDNSIFIFITKE